MMHVSTLLTLSALAGLTSAIVILLPPHHPHNASSTHLQALNTTQIGAWPPIPFQQPITENIFVNIIGYGRNVCLGRADCEAQVRSDMNEIGWDIILEYQASASHAYSFNSGGVNFCIKQIMATDNTVVLKVLHALHDLTRDYGTTELLRASIVIEREVVAKFMLTFPEL